MPDLESAAHYPGLVLFEATNLSVGRGTAIAFQVIAAPWLDPAAVRATVEPVPGAVLRDTLIVPLAPPDAKYSGLEIPALRVAVTDRLRYDPVATAVRLLVAVRARHADSLRIAAARFDRLAGTDALRTAIERGAAAESIVAGWEAGLQTFRSRRGPYLLYPDELP
jgi:uncharacterized protein YbbC (DUF1343 family)